MLLTDIFVIISYLQHMALNHLSKYVKIIHSPHLSEYQNLHYSLDSKWQNVDQFTMLIIYNGVNK